jgi:hypothetical protein
MQDEIVEIRECGDNIALLDIEVDGDHLFWANGILTHNSSIDAEGKFNHSHVAGGISKINTADNVFSLYAPTHMKEKGEFRLTCQKARSSASLDKEVTLCYNNESMRLTDPTGESSRQVDRSTPPDDLRKEMRRPQATQGISLNDLIQSRRKRGDV